MSEQIIQTVQRAMGEAGVPALLVSDIINVRWMTGFTGSFGFCVLTPTERLFISDSRYSVQASQQVKDMRVVTFGSPDTLFDVFRREMGTLGILELAVEPSVSWGTYTTWTEKLAGIHLKSAGTLLTKLRQVKFDFEIAKIREACKLADACVEHAVRMLKPGIVEYDIGLEIEFFFRRQGAKLGFEPIVASGPNSAKPHARPGDRKLEVGDFVTLDLGCELDGYCSDITRTFVIKSATDRHREIYDQVLRAEVECCEMMVAGANGRDVDLHARAVLDEKDMAKYFGHSLGHGLGCEVHDPGRLHLSADQPLVVGNVFTIEPGVYIEGFGGVRVEDDVVVTEGGPEILTQYDKSFTVLD